MLRLFLFDVKNFFIQLWKGVFRSTEILNTTTQVQMPELLIEDKKEEKELGWFQQKQTTPLWEAFSYTPTPVYGSNFSDNAEPIGWLMADGSIRDDKGIKIEQEHDVFDDDVELIRRANLAELKEKYKDNTYEIPMIKFKPREVKDDL
jgi:hypothetical protein